MSPDAHDDQALRLFRAAHADLSFRADVKRRTDSALESLIASVIEDNARLSTAVVSGVLGSGRTLARRLTLVTSAA
jgi:hypothetical protein